MTLRILSRLFMRVRMFSIQMTFIPCKKMAQFPFEDCRINYSNGYDQVLDEAFWVAGANSYREIQLSRSNSIELEPELSAVPKASGGQALNLR